jgi:hypothetical protein
MYIISFYGIKYKYYIKNKESCRVYSDEQYEVKNFMTIISTKTGELVLLSGLFE